MNVYDFPIGSFVKYETISGVRVGIVVNLKENDIGETVLEVQWKGKDGYYGSPSLCHPNNVEQSRFENE